MKLYASPTSPYARIVRVVLQEKGLGDAVEAVWVNPWEDDPALLARNPFARVPALELDDGRVLTESALIALQLEERFPQPPLAPAGDLTDIHRKLGLAVGLIDAAVGVFVARRMYGDAAADDPLAQRRFAVLERALGAVDVDALGDPAAPDLGDLAVAVALAYVAFRMTAIDLDERVPALMRWQRTIAARPSFEVTRPDL